VRSTRGMTRGRWRAARYGTAAVAVVSLAALSACSSGGSSSSSSSTSASASSSAQASGGGSISSLPRNETLYTTGTSYGPPVNWNPLDLGNFATGTQGLIYEPLNLYDPLKNGGTYDPWLATNTPATGWHGNKYVIDVRSGVKWSDGQPLTAADVAYSINLARTNSADTYSGFVTSVANAVPSGNTVTVTFKGTPSYPEFEDYLWKAPVLPEHIWSKFSANQIATAANTNPVGTGPMTVYSSDPQEVAYQTKPGWWASSALGLNFKFKYLVDIVNYSSNGAALGQFTAANIDWSNNYLPGINNLITAQQGNGGYTIKTFYPKTPYMLSGNTVWLEPNTAKAPMNNVHFRRALAYALNPQAIANTVYNGLAAPATPTGLLPTLAAGGWVDQSVVSKYGATYNPGLAKQQLAQSGYHGQTLTLMAPQGWTDWNTAQGVIQSELSAVGINVQIVQPQAPARQANLTNGNYDLALDNNAALDTTPWSYFQRVYQLPIAAQQTSQLNWERYNSPADYQLVQKAAATPPSNTTQLKSIYSQLEADFLQQQPEIPLWYNGVWFQGNTQHWQNYPSSTSSNNQYMDAMWGGYIGAMTTVYALANLQPTPQKSS
jgi:peptide/nickel transport system substrate-binding protein